MAKIPFKVSARAGKLLGRENFSNPEGAIIELVKNSYDADAKFCLVLFDIPMEEVEKNGKKRLVPSLENGSIYIADNGDGMTKSVISNHWMQIGTGNKESNHITLEKRIKTGAKGIGRFALDRLGYKTEMSTVALENDKYIGHEWTMNWNQFDSYEKSISQIEADLFPSELDLEQELKTVFPCKEIEKLLKEYDFRKGTILKVTNLKDEWHEDDINNVFKSLEALIPPRELNISFQVFFKHFQQLNEYGNVDTAFFNDYDYKLTASYNAETLIVDFTITRNELDLKSIETQYNTVYRSLKYPYDLNTIKKKEFKYSKAIDKVLKWKLDSDNKLLLKEVGSFDLAFYYLKFVNSLKEGYPYKKINPAERRAVLDKFGGVKVYRDSFRVRPYGDLANDWLKLGRRVAQSPAGAGQRIGDWRVRPEQTAGIITISRKTNPLLIDKSDRGSLQENNAFDTFKSIIVGIIHEFEVDRTKILNPLYKHFQQKKKDKREAEIEKSAIELAKKIVEDKKNIEKDVSSFVVTKKVEGLLQKIIEEEEKKKFEQTISDSLKKMEEEEKKKFEQTISDSLKKITADQEQLFKEELVQVRALASLGLIVSSFAHELHELKNNSVVIKYLKSIYQRIIPNGVKETEEYVVGLEYLDIIQRDRSKIVHWIQYSLNSIKKDKRKRKGIGFESYLKSLKGDWSKILTERNIDFEISNKVDDKLYEFRGFEMDMNTVFGNLLNNSIDSFKQLNVIRDKKVTLELHLNDKFLEFTYSDNGVGLSEVFENPDDIFLPFTTSKKNRKGEDIGTGLGMYLAKNTIDDYNGFIDGLKVEEGFCIRILLPIRKIK